MSDWPSCPKCGRTIVQPGPSDGLCRLCTTDQLKAGAWPEHTLTPDASYRDGTITFKCPDCGAVYLLGHDRLERIVRGDEGANHAGCTDPTILAFTAMVKDYSDWREREQGAT